MIVGEVNTLKVKRISDISYILEDGENEIFLHKREAKRDLNVGDIVSVFIYQDSKKRYCASEETPLITKSKPTFLKVVEVKEGVGYFLYDGMPKDLLLAEDDCIFEENEKPIIGDYLFVYLKITPQTYRARLVPKIQFSELFKPIGSLKENEFYKAIVTSKSLNGLTLYTTDGFEIFVPKGSDRGIRRIGELVQVNIVKKIDDAHYHGSLLKKKVIQLDEDAKRVYNYLKQNKNEVLSEDLSPIDIYNKIQLSKGAFKRAVGRLYKERIIEICDGLIKLKVE